VGAERRDFDLLPRDAFGGDGETRLGLRALRGGRDGRRAASCVVAGHVAGDDPGGDLRTGRRNRLLRLTRGAWNGRCFRNRRHGRHGSRWLALRLGRGLLRLGRRFLYFGSGLLRLGGGLLRFGDGLPCFRGRLLRFRCRLLRSRRWLLRFRGRLLLCFGRGLLLLGRLLLSRRLCGGLLALLRRRARVARRACRRLLRGLRRSGVLLRAGGVALGGAVHGLLRLLRGRRRFLRCFLQLRNGAEHRFLHLLVTRHLAGGLGTALRVGAAVLRRLGGARGALRRGGRRLDRFRRSLPHRHPAEERLVLLDALLCFRERGLRPPERLACLLRRLFRLDFDLFLVHRQGLLRLVGSLGPLAVRAVELRKGSVDVLADHRDPRHQVLERTALLARLVVRRRCLRVRCRDLIDGAARLRDQHARALVDGGAALLDALPEGTLHLLPQLVDLRVLVLELRDELLRLLLVFALLLLVPAGEGVVLRLGGLAVLVGFAHRVVLHLVGGRDALVGAAAGGVGTLRQVADQI